MKRILTGGLIGGLLAYFLDPQAGNRRRGLLRDKLTRTQRVGGRMAATTVERVAERATGAVREKAPHQRDNPDPDDITLRDRVESEIFRDPETSRKHININVVDHIVEVRGELPNQTEIDELIARIRAIPDVEGVASYLHLPGTPAPNKADALNVS